MKSKIVLAYSGGLDTSAIIPWLKENYKAEVIAYCCDVGNLPNESWLKNRAMNLGASEFIFENLNDLFVDDFVFQMLRAGATYQDDYLLGTAIARPLIAERIAIKAKELGATAIAHGATGKGNDQLRFEKAWAYLVPDLKIISPWREWSFKGRSDLLNYLAQKGFELEFDSGSEYSIDSNLLHTSTEGSYLENIESQYKPEEIEALSKIDNNSSTDLTIQFEGGFPVGINEKSFSGANLLKKLNEIGMKHGLGVVDLVEERMNGIKSRGIYVTPGGTLLQFALKQLKQICWSKEMYQLSQGLSQSYGDYIYDGAWFSEPRFALEEFFKRASLNLNGEIGLKLKGTQIIVTKRMSPFNLYNSKHVSFEEDEIGFNKAAEGYIVFATYPSKMAGLTSRVQL